MKFKMELANSQEYYVVIMAKLDDNILENKMVFAFQIIVIIWSHLQNRYWNNFIYRATNI